MIRKIKTGKVKINNKYFEPKKYLDQEWLSYDGRLDGMKYVFFLYYKPTLSGLILENFINMWGTVENYRKISDQWDNSPECINGKYNWEWWEEIK